MSHLEEFGLLEENASLKTKNTYRIETSTRYLLHPRSVLELQSFLQYAKEKNISYFILGNGSNVILSDTPYPGVVVLLDEFKKVVYQENALVVGAGVMLNALALDILNHGLVGLEWASGIPGTIGGSIHGNAGAYKACIFDFVKSVTYLDENLELITKEKEELSYDYRTSVFKENPQYIIVEAELILPKGNKDESLKIIEDRRKRRRESQPLNFPSAGSVFRNPSQELPAGLIIEKLGLKGLKIGDAEVSELHANFIINKGSATGKNIKDLINLIQDKVKENYHIDLVLEQEYKSW